MIIEKAEITNQVVHKNDGNVTFDHTERSEWKFDRPTQLDIELAGTQMNSVWFSPNQELFEREDLDSGWERGVVLPELRRATLSLGMTYIATNHKTIENLILDGLGRLLDFKAEEIIDTPEFPCGKDSDDLYMEGAGIVNEVLHHVTEYINRLQEANVNVDDLVDQAHTLYENVYGWDRKHEAERESA